MVIRVNDDDQDLGIVTLSQTYIPVVPCPQLKQVTAENHTQYPFESTFCCIHLNANCLRWHLINLKHCLKIPFAERKTL